MLLRRNWPLLACVFAIALVGATMTSRARAASEDDARISPGLQLKPARIALTIEPGARDEVELTLRNTTGKPIDVQLLAIDLQASDSDAFARAASGTPTRSARRWFDVPGDTIEIAPQASEVRRIAIDVPADARPGAYAVALAAEQTFSSVDTLDTEAVGSRVRALVNLGSTVVVDVAGDAIASARITDVESPRLVWGSDDASFDARVANTGDTLLELEAVAEVSAFGAFAQRDLKTATELPTLPDGERTLHIDWTDRPWIGWFRPHLVVAGGSGSGVRLERDLPTVFVIPPWWVLALVAAAIALPIWSSRRRRRRMAAYRDAHLRRRYDTDDDLD